MVEECLFKGRVHRDGLEERFVRDKTQLECREPAERGGREQISTECRRQHKPGVRVREIGEGQGQAQGWGEGWGKGWQGEGGRMRVAG